MKTLLRLIILIAFSTKLQAQPLLVELMAGEENVWYQHGISKKIHGSNRFGYSHVSSIHRFYDEKRKDELMSQSYVTYKVLNGVVAALGSFYATQPGPSLALGVQLSKRKANTFVLFVPRFDIKKNGSYEGMLLIEYQPPLSEKIRMYSRAQAMSNFSASRHNRSYQNFRLGITSGNYQLGFALNVDEFGAEKDTQHNVGVFVRTEL